ncbi:hypothetical protein SAMN04488029_2854 [Reichenbachiella faecimaris]|uniref:Uncharacterized protein n=1 Tax=Reichenbachiella faecimaris TaxID=692418 RepID=A0A1W2GJD2_REIFA|nr:hypothetical protein [Reichenbachiella faecimaris]SMD36366.1 hypothetical protein SAMN04488029_2854 [Reichenbachiella faecimaris]
MKKLNGRYSKILLILLGVLVAIVIGFQSSAVGFDSEADLENQESVEQTPTFDPSGKLHLKLLSLLK